MQLFTLRYRHTMVQEGMIEARDLATAEKVGHKYCDLKNWRFISVRPAIICGEEVLQETDPEKLGGPPKFVPPPHRAENPAPPGENTGDLAAKLAGANKK